MRRLEVSHAVKSIIVVRAMVAALILFSFNWCADTFFERVQTDLPPAVRSVKFFELEGSKKQVWLHATPILPAATSAMAWRDEDGLWALFEGASTSDGAPESLLQACLDNLFLDVLTSPQARQLLLPVARAFVASTGPGRSAVITAKDLEGVIKSIPVEDALPIAVSSLHAFVQLNWTGPDLPEEFNNPLSFLRRVASDAFPQRSVNAASDGDEDDKTLSDKLQQACLEELTWNGEPAYHLCKSPFFLLFAQQILQSLPGGNLAVVWWRLRAASIHSRILDTPVSPQESLFSGLRSVQTYLIDRSQKASSKEEKNRWTSLLAKVLVDEGLVYQRCGNEKVANDLFVKAARASGLRYEVTGALGRRTKYQKEEKMILVLLAESSLHSEQREENDPTEEENKGDVEFVEGEDEVPDLATNASGWKAGPSANQVQGMPSELSHNDDTLLEQTRFSSTSGASGTLSHIDASKPTPLHPLDSSILLALCLNISNTSPEHGLTSSQIFAFVTRVLAHAKNWSVHTLALLLRSRLEASRTRTAQRSVLQMQALLDQMPTSDSTLTERLLYFHELDLPSTWEMQAELAKRYAALGVIKSALEIFERIEMWEEAVQCWGAIGRQDRGVEVVKDLLEGRKVEFSQAIQNRKQNGSSAASSSNVDPRQSLNKAREAKLWCLLGDLEVSKSDEHYLRAWQVSQQRSARAARSLGGTAFALGKMQDAILWLRRALKINPLYSRSWFMLGCAYMRLDTLLGFKEAARCFRRCTSLDDEDGESWNNLASCYLRLSQEGRNTLQEAQLAEYQGTGEDAAKVLDGLQIDNDADRDSLHSSDSGISVESSGAEESEEEDEVREAQTSGASTAFDVKMLAHRALSNSLRFSHDDWRVWNNYTIVSVDCGLMGEAVRGMTRVIELKSSRTEEDRVLVDVAVLNRLVDAVIRAPSKESDAVEGIEGAAAQGGGGQINHNPHEGHGLYPALSDLFTRVILLRISSSADIFRAYARLLFWRGRFRSALEAHLNAWRVSYGSDANIKVTTEKAVFIEAVEALKELCEIMENFAEREVHFDKAGQDCDGAGVEVAVAMANWQFRVRSLIRSFMGRTKDSFDGEPEWDELIELRSSFSK